MASFIPSPALICATILAGVYDVNRNEKIGDDEFKRIEGWYESVIGLGLHGVVFHNTFSAATIARHRHPLIQFVEVAYDQSLNPNVFRYLIYQDFLAQYASEVKHLFVTDISDVVVLCNPFVQSLWLAHPDALFCGDELAVLDNEWMRHHSTHLRNSIADFGAYEQQHQADTLLNCGIIGGSVRVMRSLMDELSRIHRTYTTHNQTPCTLDMGAFNYVARTQFGDRLHHGAPVNTLFKQYETQRMDCWFRHK